MNTIKLESIIQAILIATIMISILAIQYVALYFILKSDYNTTNKSVITLDDIYIIEQSISKQN